MNRLQQGLATAMIAVVMSIAIGSAQAATWTGPLTGEEYSTATNWDDGLAPASNSTQDINTAATVERSVDSTAGRTFISGGQRSTSRAGSTTTIVLELASATSSGVVVSAR